MQRRTIQIDSEKCIGCGACAIACREGAIGMIDGKARLLRVDHCDGLGNCLPVCPVKAITFAMREAPEHHQTEAKQNTEQEKSGQLPCGCAGTNIRIIKREETAPRRDIPAQAVTSQLGQWPVQIKLVPVNAPYFENANLLVAADCAAYAHGNFHSAFMKNRITLIGCPKLDEGDYSEKLTAILKTNNLRSITVVRMEVPCCGGIENAVRTALRNSGAIIPWQIVTLSTDGRVLD